MRHRVAGVLACLTLALPLALGACTGETQDVPAPPATPPSTAPVELTFGVFGNSEEVQAYQRVASSYNAVTRESDVRVVAYDSADELSAAVARGEVPDVFLTPRSALGRLLEDGVTRPVTALLDERGVDFGDGYSRDSLEAFSLDRDLQCMPYGVAPDVVFYNKRWVEFTQMALRGLPAPYLSPDQTPRWDLEEFTAAVQFGTRPRRDVAGLHVAPTLRGLAPFVLAAGGTIYDDDEVPTSLAFSDGSTREALAAVLPLLRDARLAPSAEQLAAATPVQLFERGRLAMMVGNHSLVPELRAVEGLDFDVMPIPTISENATVGDVTGMCLSDRSPAITEAADFLAHAVSDDSVRQVVQAGYLSPANQTVALSDDFLQPGQEPEHSSVFVRSIRDLRVPPLLRDRGALAAAVEPDITALLTAPILQPTDIETITAAVDEASRAVLDPGGTTAPEEPDGS